MTTITNNSSTRPIAEKVRSAAAREQQRTLECPLRYRGGCADVTTRLGWENTLSLDVCDKCWQAGGLEGGQAVRDTYVAETVAAWKAKIGTAPADVFTALTINHMTAEEAARARQTPEQAMDATKRQRWAAVEGKWHMAESFIRSMRSRGPGALVGGGRRVELAQRAVREASCARCSSKKASEQHPGKHYCNDCGCGDRALALLDEEPYAKLDYPYLECPRQMPGFSNAKETPPVVPMQVDRLGTTAQPYVFNADTCGAGDICVHAWQAQGLRSLASPAAFYTTSAVKRELIELLGQEVTDQAPHWPTTGGRAPHYMHEIKEDRGKRNRLRVWTEQMGLTAVQRPPIVLDEATRERGRKHLEGVAKGRRAVLLFPFAEWGPRRWPMPYWLDLAWGLEKKGVATVCMHQSGKEIETKTFPYRVWGQGWKDVAAMMLAADAVVGNDSGPAHLAGNLGVPTVALMGSTARVFEHYGCVKELFTKIPCSPCFFGADRGFRAACDVSCQALMRMLPEQVCDVVMEMLK